MDLGGQTGTGGNRVLVAPKFFTTHIRQDCTDEEKQLLLGGVDEGNVGKRLSNRFKEMYEEIFGSGQSQRDQEELGSGRSSWRSSGSSSEGGERGREDIIISYWKRGEQQYRKLMRRCYEREEGVSKSAVNFLTMEQLRKAHDAAVREVMKGIARECYESNFGLRQQLYKILMASQAVDWRWIEKVNEERQRMFARMRMEELLEEVRREVLALFPVYSIPAAYSSPEVIEATMTMKTAKCLQDFTEKLSCSGINQEVVKSVEKTMVSRLKSFKIQIKSKNKGNKAQAGCRKSLGEAVNGLFHVDTVDVRNRMELASSRVIMRRGCDKALDLRIREKKRTPVSDATRGAVYSFKQWLQSEFPLSLESNNKIGCFFEEPTIIRRADSKRSIVVREFKNYLLHHNVSHLEGAVESLNTVLKSMLKAHIGQYNLRKENADKWLNKVVEQLFQNYLSTMEIYLQEHKFVKFQNDFYEPARSATMKIFENIKNKPGNEWLHKKYSSRLQEKMFEAFGAIVKKVMDSKHSESPKSQEALIIIIEHNPDAPLKDSLQQAPKTNACEVAAAPKTNACEAAAAPKSNVCEAAAAPKSNACEVAAAPKSNACEVAAAPKTNVGEAAAAPKVNGCEVAPKQNCLEVVDEIVAYYLHNMKAVMDTDNWTDEDYITQQHKNISLEAIKKYEELDKRKTSLKAAYLKTELDKRIEEQYKSLKTVREVKCQLAHSRTKNVLNDCLSSYKSIMKDKMKQILDENELETCHKQTLDNMIVLFKPNCQVRHPESGKEYIEQLKKTIGDSFAELRELFELKRAKEEMELKLAVVDVSKYYSEEMEKCSAETCDFITLVEHHKQAIDTAREKFGLASTLSKFQEQLLEYEFGKMLDDYTIRNDIIFVADTQETCNDNDTIMSHAEGSESNVQANQNAPTPTALEKWFVSDTGRWQNLKRRSPYREMEIQEYGNMKKRNCTSDL